MEGFFRALDIQRWDDHRYYHHSRVNQSLHLLSALSFLCMYVLLFIKPAMAALVGWLVAMVSRQVGHFFFEPKSYDEVNHATHEYKEAVKVGYNLRRKVILLSVCALTPLVLLVSPDLGGQFSPANDLRTWADNVGVLWLCVGIGGLLARTVQLFFQKDAQTGLVWLTKIITDPFHDIKLYHKAPLRLLQGESMDPTIQAERPA
jgi:hypothetical protein